MAKKKQQVKKKAKTSSRRTPAKNTESELANSSSAFVRGVLVRGEAAKPSKSGKLPKEATHEIVEDAEGRAVLKRHKFTAY